MLIALKERFTNAFNQTPPLDGNDFKNYGIFSVEKDPNATNGNEMILNTDIFCIAKKKPNVTTGNEIYLVNFNATCGCYFYKNADAMFVTQGRHTHGIFIRMIWVLDYGEGKISHQYNNHHSKNYMICWIQL